MSLELDILSSKMEKLLSDIIIQQRVLSLENFKNDLFSKKELINEFINNFKKRNLLGKNTKRLLEELGEIKVNFNDLHDNIDDKLMIFIIGNGNVGKSTLLNSLIGEGVAKTNFLPNTWKIDVYSPELQKEKAVIKYIDGKKETLSIDEVREIVNNEEKKLKESKNVYNINLKNQLKDLKIKEERKEMKKFLAEKYLYKSKISEVWWPVDKNWILDKCHLVDTQGLNQDLYNSEEQLGNIHDYYYKADGVLWILNGQTIAAANASELFDELNKDLQNIGGVRENIIGVINRMDLVRKNGGEEAVIKVHSDAQKIFEHKFSKIVDISAHQAFEGIKNNKVTDINESGILTLKNAIMDIFLKSDSIKNEAKLQGRKKLLQKTLQLLKNYYCQVEKYDKLYNEKKKELLDSKEKFKNNLISEVNSLFEWYLNEVKKSVDSNIDELANGKGSSFIINSIYKLDDFIKNVDTFMDKKQLEIKNKIFIWEKLCKISEYKYIQNTVSVEKENILVNANLNLDSLNNIKYFTPSVENNLFSHLGNIFGKMIFRLRRDEIKNKINNIIKQECTKMKKDIINQIDNNIEENVSLCKGIINITFRNILFDFKDVTSIKEKIKELELKIKEEKESVKLKDIIFYNT